MVAASHRGVDNNRATNKVVSMLLKANKYNRWGEQRVSMYSLAARGNEGQKVRRAAVRKKRTLLKMMGVSELCYLTLEGDGMRRMEDL